MHRKFFRFDDIHCGFPLKSFLYTFSLFDNHFFLPFRILVHFCVCIRLYSQIQTCSMFQGFVFVVVVIPILLFFTICTMGAFAFYNSFFLPVLISVHFSLLNGKKKIVLHNIRFSGRRDPILETMK